MIVFPYFSLSLTYRLTMASLRSCFIASWLITSSGMSRYVVVHFWNARSSNAG